MKKLIGIILLFTVMFVNAQTYTKQTGLINWTGLSGMTFDSTTHTLQSDGVNNGNVWVTTSQATLTVQPHGNTDTICDFNVPNLTATSSIIFGLSAAPLTTTNSNGNAVLFGWYVNGALTGTYEAGDIENIVHFSSPALTNLRIVIVGTTVYYYMGGSLYAHSSAPANLSQYYVVADFQVNDGWTPPIIQNASLRSYQLAPVTTVTVNKGVPLTIAPSHGSSIHTSPSGSGVFIIPIIINPDPTIGTAFTFTLPSAAMTSAGLYRGDTLINALWSMQPYSAGAHDSTISGYDQNGIVLPDGNYSLKIVSSNLLATPIGTYMNSSDSFHGNTVWRGESLSAITFVGSKGYVCTGYDEAQYPRYMFDTSLVGQKVIISNKITAPVSSYNCTDGTKVYWCEQAAPNNDNGRKMNFIYATDLNGAESTFSNGKSFNGGFHNSVIDTLGDVTNNTNRQSMGIAVQKSGNYLYNLRGVGINILNKTTGALIGTINITNATGIAIDQSADQYLWLIQGSALNRYTINSDGTLSMSNVQSINSVSSPQAIALNAAGTRIAAIDFATQQVHEYNTTGGAQTMTIGRLNGYYGNTVVANDAFMFSSVGAAWYQYLAYEPNGSLWIGDNGNYRTQHFSSTGTYLNQIAFLPTTYSVYADYTDTTAIYAHAFRCRINPATFPAQKGWSLERNYMARLQVSVGLEDPSTWSNGRTYASTRMPDNSRQIVELRDTGLRYTNIFLGSTLGGSGAVQLDKNGDLLEFTANYTNGNISSYYWATKPLTGFDGNNNPTYANSFTVKTTVPPNTNTPIFGNNLNLQAKLSDGSMVTLNDHGHSTGFHLGNIKIGSDSSFRWQAMNSTNTNYQGQFPIDYFDVANGVNDYAGGCAVTATNDFSYVNYHGENWKQKQTNMINIYHANGMEIGQFGVVETRAANEDAATWLTGNTVKIAVLNNNGNHILIENDESKCGGIMATRISNLSSVTTQSLPVKKLGLPSVSNGSTTDLMASLPFNTNLSGTSYGALTMSSGYTSSNGYWLTTANGGSYSKSISPDLYTYCQNSINYQHFALPYTSGNNWEVTCNMAFPYNSNGESASSFYYKIYDNAGKEIVRIYLTDGSDGQDLYVNGTKIYNDPFLHDTRNWILPLLHYLKITRIGTNITFSFMGNAVTTAVYDSTSNAGQPTQLSLEMNGNGYEIVTDIANLKFNSNKQ